MKHIFILSLIVFLSVVTINAQSYKIIVNNSNPETQLSAKQVSDFFLKKKTKWPNKTKVTPVDLSSKSLVRTDFSKKIHKKSTSQVRAFWQQSVFAGKATPPREMKNDAAVIAYVKEHKGAIAYISSNTKVTGVKVITIN